MAFISVVLAAALAGCASSAPVAYRGLSSADRLTPAADAEAPFQYRAPAADLGGYGKLMIDPVELYTGADGQFGSVSAEDRQIIADYMQQQFRESLGTKHQIVAAPEPGTLRLHLTLTGIERSTPVLSTVTHLMPVGLVVNTGLEASDRNGTFLGSVTYAVELTDASSGQLLYAYVTRQTPDALDVTASFGTLDAAREGVRIGARHLRDKLAEAPAPATAGASPLVARQ
ncbi:DUF3313 domain-containing protein [Aliidongia dinghuensis]|nr:DUF3313 domain-containing protein [Aliidongia dinghuensis]